MTYRDVENISRNFIKELLKGKIISENKEVVKLRLQISGKNITGMTWLLQVIFAGSIKEMLIKNLTETELDIVYFLIGTRKEIVVNLERLYFALNSAWAIEGSIDIRSIDFHLFELAADFLDKNKWKISLDIDKEKKQMEQKEVASVL